MAISLNALLRGGARTLSTVMGAREARRQQERAEGMEDAAMRRQMETDILQRSLLQANLAKAQRPEPEQWSYHYDPETGEEAKFNVRTGERVLLPREREAREPKAERPQFVPPQAPGEPGHFVYAPEKPGAMPRVEVAPISKPQSTAGAKKPPTASQQRAGALLTMAKGAADTLDQATPPSLIEAVATRAGEFGNIALSEERQIVNQAATQFSDALLRFTSGANTPEPEVRRYLQFLIPRFGDKKETLGRKRQARKEVIAALERAAGTPAYGPEDILAILDAGTEALQAEARTEVLAPVEEGTAEAATKSPAAGYRPTNPYAPKRP